MFFRHPDIINPHQFKGLHNHTYDCEWATGRHVWGKAIHQSISNAKNIAYQTPIRQSLKTTRSFFPTIYLSNLNPFESASGKATRQRSSHNNNKQADYRGRSTISATCCGSRPSRESYSLKTRILSRPMFEYFRSRYPCAQAGSSEETPIPTPIPTVYVQS